MSEERLFGDTPRDVERVLVAGYRRMSSVRKMERIRDLNWSLQRLALSELHERYPSDDDRALRLRLAARSFDRQTMIASFDWDPAEHG